jgi:hypothetical protein
LSMVRSLSNPSHFELQYLIARFSAMKNRKIRVHPVFAYLWVPKAGNEGNE